MLGFVFWMMDYKQNVLIWGVMEQSQEKCVEFWTILGTCIPSCLVIGYKLYKQTVNVIFVDLYKKENKDWYELICFQYKNLQ
jgi:hypothetical protein